MIGKIIQRVWSFPPQGRGLELGQTIWVNLVPKLKSKGPASSIFPAAQNFQSRSDRTLEKVRVGSQLGPKSFPLRTLSAREVGKLFKSTLFWDWCLKFHFLKTVLGRKFFGSQRAGWLLSWPPKPTIPSFLEETRFPPSEKPTAGVGDLRAFG